MGNLLSTVGERCVEGYENEDAMEKGGKCSVTEMGGKWESRKSFTLGLGHTPFRRREQQQFRRKLHFLFYRKRST